MGAAADLQPLQNQIQTAFQQATGAGISFSFGSSGSLAQQIRNGAPFDIYLSANQTFVKQLAQAGYLLPDTVRVYAYGRIALYSKSGRFHSISDLTATHVRHVAIANPEHAPYGAAARAALKGQGIWDKIQPKLVYGENVEQTFQFAQTGNADAAIVGWSQVINKGGILLPAGWHPPIAQTGAVVKASKRPELARRFLDFLTGSQGKAVLKQFGFE